MKKHSLQLFGLCLLLGAVGCKTNVPMVKHHEDTLQTKVQAAEHWKIMAQEMVGRIALDANLIGKAIYVQAPGESSAFSDAYHKLLISELMRRSFKVASAPEAGQVALSVKHQLIEHGTQRFLFNPSTVFGAIGFGLKHLFDGDDAGTDSQTRTELLVTTSLHEHDVLRYSDTQIVYVSPNDAQLYATEGTIGANVQNDWHAVEARARAASTASW